MLLPGRQLGGDLALWPTPLARSARRQGPHAAAGGALPLPRSQIWAPAPQISLPLPTTTHPPPPEIPCLRSRPPSASPPRLEIPAFLLLPPRSCPARLSPRADPHPADCHTTESAGQGVIGRLSESAARLSESAGRPIRPAARPARRPAAQEASPTAALAVGERLSRACPEPGPCQ